MDATKTPHRGGWASLAWVPILAYGGMTAIALYLDPDWVFEPRWLLPILNLVFRLGVGLLFAYMAARAYLTTGALSALTLGAAMLVMGVGSSFAAQLVSAVGPQASVPMHWWAMLLTGAGLLAGAGFMIFRPTGRLPGPRGMHLVVTYAGAVGTQGAILALVLQHAMPPVFIPGEGPTRLGVAVLGTATAAFLMASLLFWHAFALARFPFLRWYAVGLLLFGVGLAVLLQQERVGTFVAWAGRWGQFLGGAYILGGLWQAHRMSRGRGDAFFGMSLLQSTLPYRPLVESTSEAMIAVNAEGQVLYWNEAAARLFGYAGPDVFGAELLPLIVPRDQLAEARLALSEGDRGIELEFTGRDGRSFPGEVSRYHEGNLTVWAVRDVTERKRAEAALREANETLAARVAERTAALRTSEEHYRLAMQATNDAIWDLDLRAGSVHWNDQYEQAFGRPPETGNSWQWWIEHIHPEDRDRVARGLRDAIDGPGSTWISEYRFLRADGAWADIWDRAFIARDATGKACRVVGAMHDQTERKRADEAIAAAQRQVQSIIDNTPAIIYAFDLDERFVLANATLAQLFNTTPDQMLGKRRHEFMPAEDADWHEANDRRVIGTGRALEFEERSHLPNRTITWLTTKFPLRDGEGRIQAVAGISTDVSERKRAEAALTIALQEKEAALATNQALLREVHHRVKNNLQMLCDLMYLQMEAMPDRDQHQDLQDAYSRIYAIARLHEQLYQSLGGGRIRLEEYLRRLAGGFEALFSAAVVKVESAADETTLDLDRAIHVGLIVNELVTNALKHAFPGGHRPGEVTVALRTTGEHVELQVRDNGHGLPPDLDLERTTSLGLRTVHLLATRLHATVSVANDHGASFTLTFPLEGDEPVEPQP